MEINQIGPWFQDVARLRAKLPNLVSDYLVPYKNWNHMDYLWAIDADRLVYSEVLKNLAKFSWK
jgi:lysosomal acid lipase/cholesteryl ester hydrolase